MLLSDLLENYWWNFQDIKYSDSGKKVQAIINLTDGDLYFWEGLLRSSEWRNLLIKHTQVFKKEDMIKNITKILGTKEEEEKNILSEKIYNGVFKTMTLKDNYISIQKLKEELWIMDDIEDKYKEEDFKEKIIGLRNSWILRQWIEFRCKSCWEKYRISIDNLAENLICRWCWKSSKINIDPSWNFAFNPILKWSDAKWTFAVLHFLSSLNQHFLDGTLVYGLWVECINEDETGREIAIWDCDIFYLANGKLILCEVKYDWNLFSEKDFTNLIEIAEKVKPDVIIFAAYGKPSQTKSSNLQKWGKETKDILRKCNTQIYLNSIWEQVMDVTFSYN